MKKNQRDSLEVSNEIAKQLVEQNVDVNEVSKCIGILRGLAQNKEDGTLFFDYLNIVIAEGRAVVRSGRTLGYYRAIRNACQEYLKPYRDDPQTMAWILGWAARLMRYYAIEDRLEKPVRRPCETKAGDRRTGTVKWFNNSMGYGFIKPDDDGEDVFVHRSATPRKRGLEEDQNVEFATEETPKGIQARDVKLL